MATATKEAKFHLVFFAALCDPLDTLQRADDLFDAGASFVNRFCEALWFSLTLDLCGMMAMVNYQRVLSFTHKPNVNCSFLLLTPLALK